MGDREMGRGCRRERESREKGKGEITECPGRKGMRKRECGVEMERWRRMGSGGREWEGRVIEGKERRKEE